MQLLCNLLSVIKSARKTATLERGWCVYVCVCVCACLVGERRTESCEEGRGKEWKGGEEKERGENKAWSINEEV